MCCSSLRLWQALTYRAASMALTLFSPRTCCILIWSESESKSWSLHSICVKNFVLMSWYALHCSRKCVLVSVCVDRANTAGPLWAARSAGVGPSLWPGCGHWVCTWLKSFSVSHQSQWSGTLPMCTVCSDLNNIEVCFEFLWWMSNS